MEFIFRENTKMRLYSNCIRTGEKYITDRDYDKCTGYIKSVKISYNLVVSQKNWDKLNTERTRFSVLFR